MSSEKAGFFARYKGRIITFLVIWAILLGLLILVGGGDLLPFQYQFF